MSEVLSTLSHRVEGISNEFIRDVRNAFGGATAMFQKGPKVDIYEEGNFVVVEVEAPGMGKDMA